MNINLFSHIGIGRHWKHLWRHGCQPLPLVRPPLNELAQQPLTDLPGQIERSGTACRYLDLLGQLDWPHWWQQIASLPSPGPSPNSLIPFVLAHLVKLDKGLRNYLVMHPELVWLLGFPLRVCSYQPWGFDIQSAVPPVRRFSQVLRRLENEALQLLLAETVRLLPGAFPPDCDFGQTISLDTKHIIAWVKENNPKAYIKEGRWVPHAIARFQSRMAILLGSYHIGKHKHVVLEMFQSRMAILLGSYIRSKIILRKLGVFQSRMAILLGSYAARSSKGCTLVLVSIANGDSFGELPMSVRRPQLKEEFQSRMAILLGSYGSYFIAIYAAVSFNREWRFFWGAT